MAAFTIDRVNLPKPWEKPLLFVLMDGDRALTTEISPEATLEYREAGRIALALAFQRREDFLQAIEMAVARRIDENDTTMPAALTLDWNDLYPV